MRHHTEPARFYADTNDVIFTTPPIPPPKGPSVHTATARRPRNPVSANTAARWLLVTDGPRPICVGHNQHNTPET